MIIPRDIQMLMFLLFSLRHLTKKIATYFPFYFFQPSFAVTLYFPQATNPGKENSLNCKKIKFKNKIRCGWSNLFLGADQHLVWKWSDALQYTIEIIWLKYNSKRNLIIVPDSCTLRIKNLHLMNFISGTIYYNFILPRYLSQGPYVSAGFPWLKLRLHSLTGFIFTL